MLLEVVISRRSTLRQFPFGFSRHGGGLKLYLPGVCVIINRIRTDVSTHDVGIEPAAAAAISRLPRQDAK